MNGEIAGRRLDNQRITRVARLRPADVVSWLGAMQAQEYDAARWAIGLRMQDGTADADIEGAFNDGRILRTHVMRPTWHFVTPSDVRWLLELTAPRVQRLMASYNRRLELDSRTLTRGTAVIERALRGRRYLTRTELGERLHRAGLGMAGQRLAHLAMHAELEGIICSGPRRGRQSTYALLAERAPDARSMSRDEALATLGQRFFRSHGPATIRDFVWWSGLTTADATRALDMISARREDVGGLRYWTCGSAPRVARRDDMAHMLPVYDEYLVAYRDRDAVPHGPSTIVSGGRGSVTFQHALLIRGQVAGTWRTTRHAGKVLVHVVPLRRLSRSERGALGEAVRRYERFLATGVTLTLG
ncbi:MAG TPA: winged helix DNA-binding domain-containing protein [Vicinamibacterales bacterium]|nr:winged helix DNA-binding domain-containing protein [Vicinamibacterales bacterium]